MKFFYVYVLHNPAKNFIYIGYSENLKQRFQEHNSGKVKSTQFYKPLKLIFYEAYFTRNDAKRREKYLKTNKGKTTLITMFKDYFKNQAPTGASAPRRASETVGSNNLDEIGIKRKNAKILPVRHETLFKPCLNRSRRLEESFGGKNFL